MANTTFANSVLENKIKSILTTGVNVSNYMTLDNSLQAEAGMVKKIHTYSASGSVEDVAQGAGNTGDITSSYSESTYAVGTTQGRFVYYDEEMLTDPACIDAGVKGLAETMVNDLTSKAITEFGKATLKVEYAKTASCPSFDNIVDGIGKMNLEDEAGLFMLINPAMKAALRKELKDDLKYSTDFVSAGYIGHVAGIPVVVSKAVPSGVAFIATKAAVTAFVKEATGIEQDRDANLRKNIVYARKVAVVALTDATKVVKFSQSAI